MSVARDRGGGGRHICHRVLFDDLKLGERARLTIDRHLVDAGGEIVLDSGPMLLERPPSQRSPHPSFRERYYDSRQRKNQRDPFRGYLVAVVRLGCGPFRTRAGFDENAAIRFQDQSVTLSICKWEENPYEQSRGKTSDS